MSNVFTKAFPKETRVIEIEGLGKVTIQQPNIKEYKAIMKKYMPSEGELSMTDGLSMQFELVAMSLVEPKMTVKELEDLPKGAMPAITKIFTEIQGEHVEAGADKGN